MLSNIVKFEVAGPRTKLLLSSFLDFYFFYFFSFSAFQLCSFLAFQLLSFLAF